MDGIECTKMIRQELHCRAPVIALTAFTDEINRKSCEQAWINGFLSKSVSYISIVFEFGILSSFILFVNLQITYPQLAAVFHKFLSVVMHTNNYNKI
jgi:response regulator RpfG family c-di-GMP phosphodiesterase